LAILETQQPDNNKNDFLVDDFEGEEEPLAIIHDSYQQHERMLKIKNWVIPILNVPETN
jgi:hypothetical protein